MRAWYKRGDKVFERTAATLKREFRRSRLTTKFDEINAFQFRSESKRLYRIARKKIYDCLWEIAEYCYLSAVKEVGGEQDGAKLRKTWLDKLLSDYNSITKYVFDNEIERKRERFFESVIASLEDKDRLAIEQEYTRARNLLTRQTQQYCIDVEDEAVKKAYKDFGVERVMWISQRDGKVCKVCAERNGAIYPIDAVPPKPHPNCRCTIKPIGKGRGLWS